jgi:hypothetical protein
MRRSPPSRNRRPPLSVPSNLFASARRAIRQLVSFKETAAGELDKVRPMGLGSGGGTGGPDAVSGSLAYRPWCSWGERETSGG